MADQNFVELTRIFEVIRRWWWLILGITLLITGSAAIVLRFQPPVYESSAMLLVNPSKSSTTNQYNDILAGTQLAVTYSQMLTDRPVLETVISVLGLHVSPDSLAEQITAEPVRNSQIIKLTIKDSNPERAALIANTLAQAFTKRITALSAQKYAAQIQNAKERTESLQAQVNDLQTQIDHLRAEKVTKDVYLTEMQTSLILQQSDYKSLQSTYQNVQFSLAEITGKVFVVQPVEVQRHVPQGTNSATAVISIGQNQYIGGNTQTGESLALTYGQLFVNPSLLQAVINELGLIETPDQLSQKISYEAVTGTQLIRFTVVDDDEQKAQLIAQSLVKAFVAQVKALLSEPYSDQLESMQKQLSEMQASINDAQANVGKVTTEVAQTSADLDKLETDLTSARNNYRESRQNYEQIQITAVAESDAVIVTEPAQAPEHPSRNVILFVVIAALLGLVVGTGVVFLLMNFDTKIRTEQDVRSMLNIPLLNTIGNLDHEEKEMVMGGASDSAIAEDFRLLGNNVRLISENTSVRTLLITSPVPTEGKSLIVSNLAVSLSKMGLRVVLVDADLRLPRLHKLLGVAQSEGLSHSLTQGNINGALRSTAFEQLNFLPSGKVPPNPAEVLSSSALPELLNTLTEGRDLVLIDCPPVLAAADASILAAKVDGVLLVLRAGSSDIKSAREAIAALEQVKANVLGIVLNSAPPRRRSYYYSHYYRQNDTTYTPQ